MCQGEPTPGAGHAVHATFGERTNTSSLTPTVAQEGVEGDETGGEKVQVKLLKKATRNLHACHVPFSWLPGKPMRARRVRNFGCSRRGANSRACSKCSVSCSPASTAFSM